MKKISLTLLSAACFVAITAPAPALAAGPHGMRGHHAAHGGGTNLLETFDTNGDGQLTQAEIDGFRAERLAKFDTDGNGTLNLQEYEALWLDAFRERMVDAFQRHDDDGDGIVTTEEFNDPYANMVARMDRNDDGILSGEELRPKRHRDISHRSGARHDRQDRDDKDE
ncbi:MAG: hypothetical protein VW999_10710 [Alphaproteobacteria bacterium]